MPLASNLTPDSRFIALFIGPKHSGKTVAACSWLKPDSDKKIKLLDADGRVGGIVNVPWIQKNRIEYDYIPPRTSNPLDKKFYEKLNDNLDVLLTQTQGAQGLYETYVGDSLTSICKNFILDATSLTHVANKGKKLGVMNLTGIEEFKFESQAVDAYLSFLRSMPLNVIVTAHVMDRYDKPYVNGEKDLYAESIVVGEKLALRDKVGVNAMIYFNHIFRFDRVVKGGEERFFVEFVGDIACTSFYGLKPGRHDITGKNFREYVMSLVKNGQGDK